MRHPPSLTEEQRQVVELSDGPHLLTAPPGSGKTEVLVRRAIHLLGRSPGEVFRVLALTYTVKAAEELRTRVTEAVGPDEQWRVTATTFHSFGLDMLEHYGVPVGVASNVAVFDDVVDKASIVLPVLEQEGLDLHGVDDKDWREMFAAIARLKVDACPPDSVPSARVLGGVLSLKEAYDAYEVALATEGGIDFEGMVTQAHRLLLTDPWVGEHYRRMYRHMLIDEGQEMTTAQYEMVLALCGDDLRNVFVVADDDQSINAFAGGGPRHLRRFEENFGAQHSYLTTNFRSARKIVAVAATLAKHIETRRITAPNMVASTLATGWVGARCFSGEQAEAEGIAAWVAQLLSEGLPEAWVYEGEERSLAPHDICILGRSRYVFDAVIAALGQRGIEVLVRTEEGGLFDSPLGRAVFSGLRLVLNPRDLPSRRRLLAELPNADRAFPSEPTPDDLSGFFRSLAVTQDLPAAVAEALANAVATGGRSEVVPILVALKLDEEIGDLLWERDQEQFARRWTDYQATTLLQERTLAGFLKLLAQLERTVRDDPGVRVLTPHRARGLGFRAVVILGMNEGTFPDYRAKTDAEIDEERRTVYVAATRAARALYFTRPASHTNRYGRVFQDGESRFVAEMGLTMEAG